VSNLKWGFILGSAALVISVSLGIISGVNPLYIFLRALLFTAVFFGMGVGLRVLVDNMFPELLLVNEDPSQMNFEQPGSRVDITIGNARDYAVPEMYKNPDGSQEMGNIEDLLSGAFKPRPTESSRQSGIDRSQENDYNIQGSSQISAFDSQGSEHSQEALFQRPSFTPSLGDDSEGLGGLPDLDSMAGAFSSGGFALETAAPAQAQSLEAEEPEKKYNKGNKPQPLEGDFNPQELAQGIRTVLSRDDK
jgi:hypothetical protein